MPEEQRVIFHCDCNSFYASVELLRYPELRGVPVAVCGSPDDRHGIILAKNEPAKRYGVQTAETVWSALRKCPGLKLLPPHHGQYREMSRAVNAIYARYTDRIEPFGIDESWLDMTQTWRLFGSSPAAGGEKLKCPFFIYHNLGMQEHKATGYNRPPCVLAYVHILQAKQVVHFTFLQTSRWPF